ncbi:hypothetical protein SynBIOSE41_01662 [Synechococcus sp. BIOS-E4-1]|nr:hypothetical protein SynBIOSE41_01662 [Synechococcus sp. BIOS-E4-1]
MLNLLFASCLVIHNQLRMLYVCVSFPMALSLLTQLPILPVRALTSLL